MTYNCAVAWCLALQIIIKGQHIVFVCECDFVFFLFCLIVVHFICAWTQHHWKHLRGNKKRNGKENSTFKLMCSRKYTCLLAPNCKYWIKSCIVERDATRKKGANSNVSSATTNYIGKKTYRLVFFCIIVVVVVVIIWCVLLLGEVSDKVFEDFVCPLQLTSELKRCLFETTNRFVVLVFYVVAWPLFWHFVWLLFFFLIFRFISTSQNREKSFSS